MSSKAPYLAFETSGGLYGVPTDRVRQVVWLPEVDASDDRRRGLVGTTDLQEGTQVQVVDLDLAVGQSPETYTVDHRLIDVEAAGRRYGLVALDVVEVVHVDETELPGTGDGNLLAATVQTRVGRVDILDLDALDELPETGEAPDQLAELFAGLAPEDVAKLSRRRDRLTRQPAQTPAQQERAVILTEIGSKTLAIPLEDVVRFVPLDPVAPVPETPDHVLGLAGHRGKVLTVLDPGGFVGLDGERSSPSLAALLEPADSQMAIAVDRAGRTVTVDETAFERTGDTPCGILGSVEVDGRLVPVLDVAQLLDADRPAGQQEAKPP